MSLREKRRTARRGARWESAKDYNTLGHTLRNRGTFEEAEANIRRALRLKPEFEDAHNNLGIVLWELGRLEEAEASYRRALRFAPDYIIAHNNLGNALRDQGKLEESEKSYRRALQLNPDYARAHNGLGNVLRDQGKLEDAAACYRRAAQLNPDNVKVQYNLGNALYDQRKFEDAVPIYQRVVELNPNHGKAHHNLGRALSELGRPEEAIASYRRALDVRPSYQPAFITLAGQLQRICDWTDFAETAREVTAHVRHSKSIVTPFFFLSFSDDPEDQLLCAQQYMEHNAGPRLDAANKRLEPVDRKAVRTRDRIRLGYFSADFYNHATAILMAKLFELHDRERFEVFALSIGPDRKDPMRDRLLKAFDHFIDLQNMSDAEAAAQIRGLGIDIAVDLSAYTLNSRPGILALRPAPVQVNYLVFPGTMGADHMDYILVDPFVVPEDQQPYYTEKLVHLPDCYQVNDSKRGISKNPPSRESCGLPEGGFVFCCFCNTYKITPAVFDVWMRLLKAVPGSVLWLLDDVETTRRNLRREAQARDVEPERLVFAPRVSPRRHLARQRHADLFLDTLPYNAHTTASEALWAGLPILTCVGRAFPGRVAGSILHAIGLPELVTNNYEDYEAMALRLARDPELLETIRTKLARNRETAPLFDTDRFRLNIEAAYTEMWRLWENGEPPKAFAVQSQMSEWQAKASA